jgi:integrase
MMDQLPCGVYLRGETYWLRYRGPRPDGSWGVIRESSGGSDPKAAARLRDERIREARNDRDGIRKFVGGRQRQVTVGALLDALEKHYETIRAKGLRQAKVHLSPIRAFFGFKRVSGVSRQAIAKYIAERRDADMSDTSIDRELELLRRAFTLAAEDERPLVAWIPKIPKLVKAHANARQGFVERAEFQKVVRELPGQVLKDVAIWGYGTGMRRGEILALTWNGYDAETKTMRLAAASAKTGRARMIPLEGLPELAEVITRRLAERRPGCSLVFHRAGKPVGDFYTTWMRAVDRAKVRAFTFHDLRRSSIRNFVRAGVPERVCMEISGHKSRSIFDRYNVVSEKDLEQAMAKRAGYERTLLASDGGRGKVRAFPARPSSGS